MTSKEVAGYRVRPMAREEAAWMIGLAAREGWNPGLNDGEIFFDTDPQGFLVGEFAGRPVGCLSAVAYGRSFGFVGLYIVEPDYRGRGFGLALWQAGLARLADRNVGLDGVVAQQANYRRSGFELAYRQIRHEGSGAAAGDAGCVPLSGVSFDDIERCDRQHFATPRRRFLRRWLTQPGASGYGVVRANGELAGYGLIRRCRSGHKIGPLFADTPDTAGRLLTALLSSVPGEPVFLDTPEANTEAVALARSMGMSPAFETARMYSRGDPGFPVTEVYGVTSFELG